MFPWRERSIDETVRSKKSGVAWLLEWTGQTGCWSGRTHREWQTGRPIELRDGHFEVTEVVELTEEQRAQWSKVIERHDWWPNRNTAERINQTETEKRKPNTPYICNLYVFFTWNMCNNVTWCTNTLFRWLVRRRAKVSLSSENRCCCCLTAISLSCPVTEHHINMINASHGQLWVLFSHSGWSLRAAPGLSATFMHCDRASEALMQASIPLGEDKSPSCKALMCPFDRSM